MNLPRHAIPLTYRHVVNDVMAEKLSLPLAMHDSCTRVLYCVITVPCIYFTRLGAVLGSGSAMLQGREQNREGGTAIGGQSVKPVLDEC